MTTVTSSLKPRGYVRVVEWRMQAFSAHTEVKHMKWTPWLFGSLTVALIVGCGGDRRNTDTGTVTDTAAMPTDTTGTQPGTSGGTSSDTARTGSRIDSAVADTAGSNQ